MSKRAHIGLSTTSEGSALEQAEENVSKKIKSTLQPSQETATTPSISASSSASSYSGSSPSSRIFPSNITPTLFSPKNFHIARSRLLTERTRDVNSAGTCVILWMSRDQRVQDNHALNFAIGMSMERNIPVKVVFNLVPTFLQATIRQYGFMLKGLQEVEEDLRSRNIPLVLLIGDPVSNIPNFARSNNAQAVVCDFSPLRVGRSWVHDVSQALEAGSSSPSIPLVQVDAHNVVPCWIASNKLEYGARTIRPKIHAKLSEFLVPFAELPSALSDASWLDGHEPVDWKAALDSLQIDRSVEEVESWTPGPSAALLMLEDFIEKRLKAFSEERNDPTKSAISNLSPYIHFGQISVQRIVLRLRELKKHPESTQMFIEEAVVRRELADNFCYYNLNYDNLSGCYDWARNTLMDHAEDKREHIYTQAQLESGETHDDLWNAAQIQMVKEGKMHGFLRMYWAKKILEWTQSPEEALRIAIYLNDRYQLDGRDANGYVGCMWSIGGIHDQGWGERGIFGKIRYMNYEGCKRKFKVSDFVAKYPPASANANKVLKSKSPLFQAAVKCGAKKK